MKKSIIAVFSVTLSVILFSSAACTVFGLHDANFVPVSDGGAVYVDASIDDSGWVFVVSDPDDAGNRAVKLKHVGDN